MRLPVEEEARLVELEKPLLLAGEVLLLLPVREDVPQPEPELPELLGALVPHDERVPVEVLGALLPHEDFDAEPDPDPAEEEELLPHEPLLRLLPLLLPNPLLPLELRPPPPPNPPLLRPPPPPLAPRAMTEAGRSASSNPKQRARRNDGMAQKKRLRGFDDPRQQHGHRDETSRRDQSRRRIPVDGDLLGHGRFRQEKP